MSNYIENVVNLNVSELAAKVISNPAVQEANNEKISNLQTEITQFHDKHRLTKESRRAAMQRERRKGVLAAIGLAAVGITLVISISVLISVAAGAFITAVLAGSPTAAISGIGVGCLFAAQLALGYKGGVKISEALKHASKAHQNIDSYSTDEASVPVPGIGAQLRPE